MLNLPQQLLLLSYHEAKPLPIHAPLSFSLVGAVLAELLIQRKIRRKGPNLLFANASLTSDPILDEALTIMNCSHGEQTAKYWVNRLNVLLRNLRPRVADQLASKGFLTITYHSSLGLFAFRSYHLSDAHPALALKDQLRQVLFRPFAPTSRQMALIGLLEPLGLKLFTREERRAVRARIGEILRRDEISKAVAHAIAGAESVAAAIVAASAASAG